MRKILKYIWDNLELIVMQTCFWLLLICVCINVLLRLIFNSPLFFAEELSRIFFIWMCFWGFGYVTRQNNHIRITSLVEKFPAAMRRIIDLLINILGLAIFTWIFVNGVQYLNYVSIRRSSAMQIPMQYLVIVIPITAGITLIRLIANAAVDVTNIVKARREEYLR